MPRSPETARVLALAFDPAVATADDALAQRILDAALELAAASGLKHLTMDDVAKRARVGRMTVYRRFGSKATLLDALAVREARRCLRQIAGALDPTAPIDQRFADLFVATLKVIREHPLLQRLARVEPDALVLELTRDDSAVFRLVLDFLTGWITVAQHSGDLPPADPAPLAELALRLGASFVLIPESVIALADDEAAGRTIRALVAPLLAQAT
ncbi:MAG TPA: TetR/AcrR family transcriptional regulator [Solirubrobacteraceae bacterium]|nr:TetR/AcrR family transcriptional regulator [Solirubrobacteraceae bacterium]